MKYCKGFLVGAIILFVVNFFFGFMDNCTLSSLKESFSPKDSCEVKKDSVGEEVVNLNIAKYLQEKYGGDSLMVETISIPSSTYEYYVSAKEQSYLSEIIFLVPLPETLIYPSASIFLYRLYALVRLILRSSCNSSSVILSCSFR